MLASEVGGCGLADESVGAIETNVPLIGVGRKVAREGEGVKGLNEGPKEGDSGLPVSNLLGDSVGVPIGAGDVISVGLNEGLGDGPEDGGDSIKGMNVGDSIGGDEGKGVGLDDGSTEGDNVV